MRSAVLGLGVMGRGMAGRIADSPHELTIWNRTPRADVPGGAAVAATATEAVRDADVVILSVSDDAAVRETVAAVRGALRPGAVLVDTSTVAPATAVAVGAELAGVGVELVDAPVTGGAEAARDGRLTLLCGGSAAALDRARPVLERVSSRIVHVGGTGAGQLAKAVNQVILAGSFLGVAEGVALARRSGLDAGPLLKGLEQGAAASWVLSQRAPLMVAGDFTARGRLALHLKDLRIALAAADEVGLRLPLAHLVARLEQGLVDAGHGGDDVAAIVLAVDPQSPADPASPPPPAGGVGVIGSG